MRRSGLQSLRDYNRIKFEVKPRQEIVDCLKRWGFHWDPARRDWYAEKSVESATVIDCIKAGEKLELIGERVAEAQMETENGIR